MTLISQFKSKFKTDCKAMSYVLACRLPHFIFEHLRRRIKRHFPRAQPAVCQIFKYAGMQKQLSDFLTSKLATTPHFFLGFLASLLACTQARLLPGLRAGPPWLAHLSGAPTRAAGSRVHGRTAASSDRTVGQSFQICVSLKRI